MKSRLNSGIPVMRGEAKPRQIISERADRRFHVRALTRADHAVPLRPISRPVPGVKALSAGREPVS
jgi:hypothetical protein